MRKLSSQGLSGGGGLLACGNSTNSEKNICDKLHLYKWKCHGYNENNI